ncbi:transposase [Thalassotalea sp. G20_0]|uniref:transposase n=1 Tax=Thalassotalea sp. G20_0 TaxID=2821093 RepID=UPI001ADAD7FE|nr:transposase [Thalassotalea sp. G20_0]
MLLSATALFAAIGDISAFKNGREMAAWLGLVNRPVACPRCWGSANGAIPTCEPC